MKNAKKKPARDAQTVEAEISETENLLKELSQKLARPEIARDPGKLAALNEDYRKADERLRVLYEEWDRVAAEATSA